jgi:hypothetical protein
VVSFEAGGASGEVDAAGEVALGSAAPRGVGARGVVVPASPTVDGLVLVRVGDETVGGVVVDGTVAVGAVTMGVVTTGFVTVGVVTVGVLTGGVVTGGVVTGGVVTVGVVTIGVVTGGIVTDGTVTVGTVTVGVVTPSAAGAIAPRAAAAARARTRLTGDKRRSSRFGCGFGSAGRPFTVTDTDVQVRVETCRIELWRGYVSASFIARSTEGEGEAVSEPSKSFRWRSSGPPDTQHAKLAHYLLLMRLKDEGWTESGEGQEWYEIELARPSAEPRPDEPEPTYIEPDPLPLPLPAPVMRNVVPLPALEPRPPRDTWRVTAAVGLAVALLFLLVLLLT